MIGWYLKMNPGQEAKLALGGNVNNLISFRQPRVIKRKKASKTNHD